VSERDDEAFLGLVRAAVEGGSELVCARIRDLFTDTTVWIQPGLPTAIGADAAIDLVQTWGAAFSGYELEVRHVARTDRAVLIERFETFRTPDGSVLFELPVVGVAEFRDGKIVHWREYYDSAAIPGLRN
jgi:limonene-1,2-epoxide hydrolase